jgi:hypothetical protein
MIILPHIEAGFVVFGLMILTAFWGLASLLYGSLVVHTLEASLPLSVALAVPV